MCSRIALYLSDPVCRISSHIHTEQQGRQRISLSHSVPRANGLALSSLQQQHTGSGVGEVHHAIQRAELRSGVQLPQHAASVTGVEGVGDVDLKKWQPTT